MFRHGIDPVLVELGPVEIRYYGLAYLAAFLIAYYWIRGDYDEAFLDDLLFYGVLGVILGGRLGYFLFYNPGLLLTNPLRVFYIWQGGMSFHGGLVGALVAGWYAVRRHGHQFLQVGDFLAVPALIGLGLGRIANFINGEIVGTVTDVPWCVVFPGLEECRHPVQLYLALKNFGVAVGLYLYQRGRELTTGTVFWQFILWYAVGRFVLDFWRYEPALFIISTGQYLTLAMIATAVYKEYIN